MTCEVNVYRQDAGGWHPLFQRKLPKVCSKMFEKNGLCYGIKEQFFPDLPDGCPLPPDTYKISNLIVPRYRQDWNKDMQQLIPPMVPSADKWRVDTKIFNEENEFLVLIRVEARLINKYSSQ